MVAQISSFRKFWRSSVGSILSKNRRAAALQHAVLEVLEPRQLLAATLASYVFDNLSTDSPSSNWTNPTYTTTSSAPIATVLGTSDHYLQVANGATATLSVDDPTTSSPTVNAGTYWLMFDLYVLNNSNTSAPVSFSGTSTLTTGSTTTTTTDFSPEPGQTVLNLTKKVADGTNAATDIVRSDTLGIPEPGVEIDNLGTGRLKEYNDSVYRVTIEFVHHTGTMSLNFSVSGLSNPTTSAYGDWGTPSFGIGNLTVTDFGPTCPTCNPLTNVVSGKTDIPVPTPQSVFAAGSSAPSPQISSGWQGSTADGTLGANGVDQSHLVETGNDYTVAIVNNGGDATWFNYGINSHGDLAYSGQFGNTDVLTHDTSAQVFNLSGSDGSTTTYNDFSITDTALRGKIVSMSDAGGNVTTYTYNNGISGPDGSLASMTQSQTAGTITTKEYYNYGYNSSGLVTSIALQNKTWDSSVWITGGTPHYQAESDVSYVTIRTTVYSYYTGSSTTDYYGITMTNGAIGQLELAQTEDGSGNVIDTSYYRYYPTGSTTGAGLIKAVLNTQSYTAFAAWVTANHASHTPMDAPDSDLLNYADTSYTYNSANQVASQTVQGQGTTSFTYYTSGSTLVDPNVWAQKTVEILPDSNEEIIYSNGFNRHMLDIFADVSGSTPKFTATYTRYDDQNRPIEVAQPSAVDLSSITSLIGLSAIEGYSDLVDFAGGTTALYLRSDAGLIQFTDYDPVSGQVADTKVQRGQNTATLSMTESWTYTAPSGSNEYVVASDTQYPNAGSTTGARTTTYSYGWGGTSGIQMVSGTVTLPTLSSGENGSGATNSSSTWYDSIGRPIWTKDADGHIGYTQYDPVTGAVTETITDVNTSITSDFSAATVVLPSGWSNSGLNLVTTYQVDALGRTTEMTDPDGHETFTVYDDAHHAVFTFQGGTQTLSGSTPITPIGPISMSRTDIPYLYTLPSTGTTTYGGTYSENITFSGTVSVSGGKIAMPGWSTTNPGLLNLTGTGSPQYTIQTLSRTLYNNVSQTVESDAYFSINNTQYLATALNSPYTTTTVSGGSLYYGTTYGYDSQGRENRTVSPTLTIKDTTYDSLGRVSTVSIGTSDTSGSSNMFTTDEYFYDNQGIGDGNLTKHIQHVDTISSHDRITLSLYDWRDRLIATKSGAALATESDISQTSGTGSDLAGETGSGIHRPITVMAYDNLDEAVATFVFDGDGLPITDFLPSITLSGGYTSVHSSSLVAYTTKSYDDLGRAFESKVFSVDPASGQISTDAITSDQWFDLRGNIVGSYATAGTFTKTIYDGADRVITSYTTDGGSVYNSGTPLIVWSTTVPDTLDISHDIVLEQTERVYDANGNVVETISRQRFDNDSTSGFGSLGGPTSGTLNAARVYYSTSYYDLADRLTDSVNYGTYNGTTFTPTFYSNGTLSTTLPASSSSILVTHYDYNAAGWTVKVTDPKGIVTDTLYDALGRTTFTIANWDNTFVPVDNTSHPPSTISAGSDQTTAYTYDGDGNTLTMTAIMPGTTNNQTTQYVYDVAGTTSPVIHSNDLQWLVKYPDPSSGSPSTHASAQTVFTYDAGGDLLSKVDQNGITHTYGYDVLGRQTFDHAVAPTVTTNIADGNFTAATISSASYQYEPSGSPWSFTGASGIANNGSTILSAGDGAASGTFTNPSSGTQYAYIEGTGSISQTLTGVSAGNYTLTFQAQNSASARQETFNVIVDGTVYGGTISPSTGSWSSYSISVPLTAGVHTIIFAGLGSSGYYAALHNVAISYTSALSSLSTTIATGTTVATGTTIATSYTAHGNVFTVTTLASDGSTKNQIEYQYNGLGQLTKEFQAQTGAVNTSSTPYVKYFYSALTLGSRLTEITYPNVRALYYLYNSGLDSDISRLSELSDYSTGTSGGIANYDEIYTYLGLGTIVQRANPASTQTLIGSTPGGDGGDRYTGLDRFGRVVDLNWVQTGTASSTDRFQYTYDQNSNVTSKTNALVAANSELYTYDSLNRLTSFSRGTLNSGKTAIVGTASLSQSWNLDSVGNDTSNATTVNGGTATTTSNSFNSQNEFASIAAVNGYDGNGNTLADGTGNTFVYDEWNHLVAVKNAAGQVLEVYAYDGLGRRTSQAIPSQGANAPSTTRFYYSNQWQVLQEDVGTAKTIEYVWSAAYVDAMVLRDVTVNTGGQFGTQTVNPIYWSIGEVVSPNGNSLQAAINQAGNGLELIMYTPSGVDTNFGVNGVAVIPWTWGQLVSGLAFQPDGKILFVKANTVFRLTADGALDTTFGTGGSVSLAGHGITGISLVVDSQGRIVVAGSGGIIRLTAGGVLDTTFGDVGGTGHLGYALNSGIDGNWLYATPDGGFLVSDSGNIMKVDNMGQVDVGFGTLGNGTVYLGGYNVEFVTPTHSYKFVVCFGGSTSSAHFTVGLARLNADGTWDESFGNGSPAPDTGIAVDDGITGVAIAPDEGILLGYSGKVVKVLADGSGDDSSFGTSGTLTLSSTAATPTAFNGIIVAADGQIVGSGYYTSSGSVTSFIQSGSGGGRVFVQQDANWNVTALLDPSGNVVERYLTDPKGKVTVMDGDWNVKPNGSDYGFDYGFQGLRFDGISQTYDGRNREYSVVTETWMTKDPTGYPDGMNPYETDVSNPINRVDPAGLAAEMQGQADPTESSYRKRIAEGWKYVGTTTESGPGTPEDIVTDNIVSQGMSDKIPTGTGYKIEYWRTYETYRADKLCTLTYYHYEKPDLKEEGRLLREADKHDRFEATFRAYSSVAAAKAYFWNNVGISLTVLAALAILLPPPFDVPVAGSLAVHAGIAFLNANGWSKESSDFSDLAFDEYKKAEGFRRLAGMVPHLTAEDLVGVTSKEGGHSIRIQDTRRIYSVRYFKSDGTEVPSIFDLQP